MEAYAPIRVVTGGGSSRMEAYAPIRVVTGGLHPELPPQSQTPADEPRPAALHKHVPVHHKCLHRPHGHGANKEYENECERRAKTPDPT